MIIIKTIFLFSISLLAFITPVFSEVIFQDDFGVGSSDNWATRLLPGASIEFRDALILTPNADDPQPASAYRSFQSVSLADGEVLRITFEVSASSPDALHQNLKIGLGFADPLIIETSGDLGVPLRGYNATLPINTTYGSVVRWVDGSSNNELNFFNDETVVVGSSSSFPAGASVTTVSKTVAWEIARYGSTLEFSGSLDGTEFSSGTAMGENVLPDFEFNTVGVSFAYDGASVTYENLKLEVIRKP